MSTSRATIRRSGMHAQSLEAGRARPAAIYFRPPLSVDANPVRVLQNQEVVDRIAANFRVTVVEEGGDYRRHLDDHRPDVAIFESNSGAHPPEPLTHVRDDRSVPKALLIRSDAMCYTRPILLQRVEDYGIDACFAVDSLYGYYLEELRDRLFFMPHSVDPALFRDRGLPKTDVVTFFGHFLPSRPWRIEVAQELRRSFPCTFLPHDTSRTNAATTRMLHGETYARQIGRAMFAPVEGSFQHLFTRKFFEVPACGTALVVPRIPALAEYGFRDMENCIQGDPAEVGAKMQAVLDEPGRYETLARRGAELVSQRHVHGARTQLGEWLQAFRAAGAGRRVRQSGIFQGFEVVPSRGSQPAGPIRADMPIDHYLLRKAAHALAERRVADAEQDFIRCMNLLYARYFLEPRFGLAMVRLLQGRAAEAIYFLSGNYITRVQPRGGTVLDPREAAMLVLAYRCLQQPEKAAEVARLHRKVNHPELAWASEAVDVTPDPIGARARTLFTCGQFADRADWTAFENDALAAHAVEPTDSAAALSEPAAV